MIRSLYLKILLHWFVALIVTEALIFALFVTVVGESHQKYLIRTVGENSLVAREYLEAAVAAGVAGGTGPYAALDAAVHKLAATARAKVWVTGSGGDVVAASFSGKLPQFLSDSKRSGRQGDARVSVSLSRKRPWFAEVPLALPDRRPLTLYIAAEREVGAFPIGSFAAGLAAIGALVALLAVPLSLRIARPLKRLQESALRIAGGDLSSRAAVSGKDEIGRLGVAFNAMAEKVERMVRGGKELTANISHELRSPLARIRVAGECLREAAASGDRDGVEEMLEAMWEDIDEADRMIGRILEFSKLDLHAPLIDSGEVRPAEVIEGLARTLGPLAKSRGIGIELYLDREAKVAADGELLRTAFKNLLENAVRHTLERGGVRIEVRREEGWVAVEFVNPVAPLPAEELELIFDPFYRGKGAQGEGSGLGLAMVKKIVLLHRGEVTARNVPEGLQLLVRLPAALS